MAYSFDPQIIARLLTGLGASASAYGSGSPQWGFAGAQAMDQQAQAQQIRAQQNLQTQIQQSQLQRQQQADADALAQKAAAKSWLLGQPAPTGTGAREPGAMPGTSGALASLPEAQRSYFTGMAGVDPVETMQAVGQELFKEPEKPTVNDGMQYDASTGSWSPIPGWLDQKRAIAEAGRAPVQPPEMPGDYRVWKTLKDQDPSTPGYTEWKRSLNAAPVVAAKDMTPEEVKAQGLPDGTVAQRDEHNNIKVVSTPKDPPADVQEYLYAKGQGFTGDYMAYQASKKGQGFDVQLPDGTHISQGGAIKPPNESQMAAGSRAQLMQDGLSKLESLYDNPDINPYRVAGGDTLSAMGPFGRVAGSQIKSDAEQQFSAAKAAALEGLAASVTGAGVAKDQFDRYAQMLPDITDKPETRKAKLQAANDYLNVLLTNAGAAAIPVRQNAGKPTAGADSTVPADLPAGSSYAGLTKDGKRAFKLPDGSLVSE